MPVERLLAETFMASKCVGTGCLDGSVDRCNAGNTATLALNLLLIFQQFVEGDEKNPIAALVQPVIRVTRDLNTEGATFFACADALASDAIAADLAEGAAFGIGADHWQRRLGMDGGVKTRLILAEIPLDRGGSPSGQLHDVGKLKTLLAGGIIPAMEVRNYFFAEAILIFSTIDIGVNLVVIALLLQEVEMLQHFDFALGRPPQQVLVIQFNKAVGVGVAEEAITVERAFGHLTHELTHAQVAALKQ